MIETRVSPLPPIRPDSAAPNPAPVQSAAAEEILRPLLGQLLMVSVSAKQAEDIDAARIAKALREGDVSGIVISDGNIVSFTQLRDLIAGITGDSGDDAPFIAVDQPGGPDSSLSDGKGFNSYISANAVRAHHSTYEARVLYGDMAAELSALGVTLNIGPSADVCGEEGLDLSASCFGTVTAGGAAYATAFSLAHHDNGLLTALRHVPYRAELQSAWPGERASIALLHNVIRLETSDALVVRVNAAQLALPPEAMFGLTQNNAYRANGFHGALLFELDMGLASAPLRYDEAIVRAFEAGADMVILRQSAELPEDISVIFRNAIAEGLKSGRLRMSRIEDAYAHVQNMKELLRALHPKTRVAANAR